MPNSAILREAVDEVIRSFRRVSLCALPTPFEPLRNLSTRLGINLHIKRDDLTGLAFGGNKARKLEFLLGDLQGQGADSLITWGGVQSNWCRLLAAAARKVQIRPVLLLFKRPGLPQRYDGNLLLDFLLDADVHLLNLGNRNMMDIGSIQDLIDPIAAVEKERGWNPYIAPIGASAVEGSMTKPLGAIGYVQAFAELIDQIQQGNLDVQTVVLATGSGGMQAGLVAGARLLCPKMRVVGISVSDARDEMARCVNKITEQTIHEFTSNHGPVAKSNDDVIVFDDYVHGGYGIFDRSTAEALRLMAREEGILLDPVYTGRALVGLLDLVQKGYIRRGENVVLLHSGGTPALFPYRDGILKFLGDFKALPKHVTNR